MPFVATRHAAITGDWVILFVMNELVILWRIDVLFLTMVEGSGTVCGTQHAVIEKPSGILVAD